MLAGFGRGDSLLGMKMNRRCDVHRVDFFVIDELLPMRVPTPRPEFFSERFGLIEARAAYRHQLGTRMIKERGGDALSRNIATPNQTPSQLGRRHRFAGTCCISHLLKSCAALKLSN